MPVDLPNDVVHRIACRWANADGQATMARVCREWRDIIADDLSLEVHAAGLHRALHVALRAPSIPPAPSGGGLFAWMNMVSRDIRARPAAPVDLTPIATRLERAPLRLARLHLEGLPHFTEQHLAAVLTALRPSREFIKEIVISNCPRLTQLPANLVACVGLERLCIKRICGRAQPLPSFLMTMPTLRVVEIDVPGYYNGLLPDSWFEARQGSTPEAWVDGELVDQPPDEQDMCVQLVRGLTTGFDTNNDTIARVQRMYEEISRLGR